VIRNIIFDWSGTLVDDLPAVWKATNIVLAQAGRPEMSLAEFRAEFSLPFTNFYNRHTPHVPLPQLEDWFHNHYREIQDSVEELPHARDFLEFCRGRGVRAFLLSTIQREHFEAQSQVTGFSAFLDRAYTGVLDKREKIHEILAENRLAPDETLFVGDMQHDIETARHGGIYSCAVLTGYNTLEQLREAKPDLIVEHLGELRRVLEQNNLRLKPETKESMNAHPPEATVGALIFNDTGKVLMIRTHKWSNLWGIPGGKIKWGEPSVDALRREIKEETGLEVSDIKFVLVQDCIHSKEFYRDAHFVLLNYTCRCAGKPIVKLNDEARESCWVSTAEALKMPLNTPTRILLEVVLERGARPPRAQRLTPRQPQRPETRRRRSHAGARVLPKSKIVDRKS
jgi:phosphoglycolate phosphatase-like HAD superfamily hydrolase/ADP-ribose pyrophosphatase YjhB (NUDIX family)